MPPGRAQRAIGAPPGTGTPVTLAEALAELETELAARRRVYPEWIQRGRIQPAEADRRLARIAYAVRILWSVQETASQRTPARINGA